MDYIEKLPKIIALVFIWVIYTVIFYVIYSVPHNEIIEVLDYTHWYTATEVKDRLFRVKGLPDLTVDEVAIKLGWLFFLRKINLHYDVTGDKHDILTVTYQSRRAKMKKLTFDQFLAVLLSLSKNTLK